MPKIVKIKLDDFLKRKLVLLNGLEKACNMKDGLVIISTDDGDHIRIKVPAQMMRNHVPKKHIFVEDEFPQWQEDVIITANHGDYMQQCIVPWTHLESWQYQASKRHMKAEAAEEEGTHD